MKLFKMHIKLFLNEIFPHYYYFLDFYPKFVTVKNTNNTYGTILKIKLLYIIIYTIMIHKI